MAASTGKPESLFRKRWRKFKALRRGHWSFWILVSSYVATWFLMFFVNNAALAVRYEGEWSLPVFSWHSGKEYGMDTTGEPNWRMLKKRFNQEASFQELLKVWYGGGDAPRRITGEAFQAWVDRGEWRGLFTPDEAERVLAGGVPEVFSIQAWEDLINVPALQREKSDLGVTKEFAPEVWRDFFYESAAVSFMNRTLHDNIVIMPVYPYGPKENVLREMAVGVTPPTAPDSVNWFGTDKSGRDVFARLVYGYRISMTFSLVIVFFTYAIGVTVGAMLGYYGGKFDIIAQRFVEIWSAMPFLYTVMLMSSLVQPNFMYLVLILSAFSWMGITYYIRGEFYREKAKDYVAAAVSQGEGSLSIIFRQILPNAITPIVTFAPFSVVSNTLALVALDFLGFGLPPDAPSWGGLMSQGQQSLLLSPWLFLFPLGAQFIVLLLVVFVGEAIREAFDPKVFSRLR